MVWFVKTNLRASSEHAAFGYFRSTMTANSTRNRIEHSHHFRLRNGTQKEKSHGWWTLDELFSRKVFENVDGFVTWFTEIFHSFKIQQNCCKTPGCVGLQWSTNAAIHYFPLALLMLMRKLGPRQISGSPKFPRFLNRGLKFELIWIAPSRCCSRASFSGIHLWLFWYSAWIQGRVNYHCCLYFMLVISNLFQ